MNRLEKILYALAVLVFLWGVYMACSLAKETDARAEPPAVNTEGLCKTTVSETETAEAVGKADKFGKTEFVKEVAEKVKPIWDEADAVALAQMAYGEIGGGTAEEKAQTMWCVLNRVDEWGGTPYSQVTAPSQFYGYSSSHPVTDELYSIAVDVLTRWQAEKSGAEVERELESGYLFFCGDGLHNYFY